MEDLGPIAILYNWQSVVMAASVAVLTSIAKRALDIAIGGEEKRKQHPWLSGIALPLVPLLLGALFGAFIPIHPDALDNYVDAYSVKHAAAHLRPWLVFSAWGAAVGVFADYIYQRTQGVMGSLALVKARSSATPPV
jgi:hypothetical protein